MNAIHLGMGLTALALLSSPQSSVWAATLTVGDKAPKIEASKWIRGEPVTHFDKDKVYLVEFWATWCGPCRVSIPHLNEIHKKYEDKGLVVIGMDVWERDLKAVEPFVKKMGDKMTYRVALDSLPADGESGRGKMADNWMKAADQKGIPAAFLVEQSGRIAWIGHPMQLKEAMLEKVLSGKFDIDQAAVEHTKAKEAEEALNTIWTALTESIENKKWDLAEAKLKEAEKLIPADDRDGLNMTRLQVLLGKKDYAAAQKWAEELSEGNQDNPMLQNAIAWEMATHENPKKLNLALAEKIARRANEAAKSQDPSILDTLARVVFLRGDEKKAIEFQQKAVALSEGDLKENLQKTLESYKDGKLPDLE